MKMLSKLSVMAVIGLGLSTPALAQAASENWYEASTNADIRTANSAVMFSMTQPFTGGLKLDPLETDTRFELGFNILDHNGTSLAFDRRTAYSFGVTGQGLTFAGLGNERLSFHELNLRFNADEDGEAKSGNGGAALLIVGGVVAVVGLGAAIASDAEDTINDCVVDLTNGPTGGCPLGN